MPEFLLENITLNSNETNNASQHEIAVIPNLQRIFQVGFK